MSSKLRLHIDATLAEISGRDPTSTPRTQQLSKKWYLPKLNLKEGLSQFYEQYPHLLSTPLIVTTSYGQHVLDKYAGETPALLVTTGFESWPFIRQPLFNKTNSARPHRVPALLSPDLVFGVSERTLVDGHIEKEVDPVEIEFLISKLKFAEIKHVAIGFLHSLANPHNEKTMAQALKENGFEVSICSDFSSTSEARPNEVARWWRTFIDSYLNAPMMEFLKPVYDFAEEKALPLQLGLTRGSGHFTDTLYSLESLMYQNLKNDFLYAGLHRFAFIKGPATTKAMESAWGPVLLNSPEVFDMPLQPTQEITITPYGTIDFAFQQVGLDPGPMMFGRSLRPTLIDLLSLVNPAQENFPQFEGLTIDTSEKIKNAIGLLARSSKMNLDESKQYLFKAFVERTSSSLLGVSSSPTGSPAINIVGPLANTIANIFERIGAPLKLKVQNE